MHEANLLTLVTLEPKRKEFGTITLQPLICSDALTLETDAGLEPPMEAVNRSAECFGDTPPNHIDIVSVAACTPQSVENVDESSTARIWHERFRSSFLAAARDPACARHHFAAIVLANFREIDATKPGGLSGVFLPVPAEPSDFGAGTTVSLWGRPSDKETDNRWSRAGETGFGNWRSRGFIAAIEPRYDCACRIFSFTIHRLPRETSPWEPATRLAQVEIRDSSPDDKGHLTFPAKELNYG